MLYTKYISPTVVLKKKMKEKRTVTIELDKVIKRWVPLNVRYMECKTFIVTAKNNYDKIYLEKQQNTE